jgi:hypothetical protein
MTRYEAADLILKGAIAWALWAIGVQLRIWRKQMTGQCSKDF